MRVGVFLTDIDMTAGGGASFETSVFKSLLELNSEHEFYFFHQNDKDLSQLEKGKNINISDYAPESFGKKRLNGTKKFNKKYKSVLNKACLDNKIDLMWFLIPGSVQDLEIPYVMTVWDLQHRIQPYFPEVSVEKESGTFESREEFYQKYLPKASYVVIGNEAGKRQVNSLYSIPESRIKPIFMPVSDAFFEDIENIDVREKFGIKGDYIYYPAQFWAHKNHIRILKALQNPMMKDVSVVFTGSDKGNKSYIQKCVADFGLEDRVHFLGFVSDLELKNLYKQAQALVFPSFFGPDNIPPLEAMALKCPVLCSNVDGLEEQLEDAALFFDPLNEFEIVEQYQKIKNESLRDELIAKGYELSKNRKTSLYAKEIEKVVDGFSKIKECWG